MLASSLNKVVCCRAYFDILEHKLDSIRQLPNTKVARRMSDMLTCTVSPHAARNLLVDGVFMMPVVSGYDKETGNRVADQRTEDMLAMMRFGFPDRIGMQILAANLFAMIETKAEADRLFQKYLPGYATKAATMTDGLFDKFTHAQRIQQVRRQVKDVLLPKVQAMPELYNTEATRDSTNFAYIDLLSPAQEHKQKRRKVVDMENRSQGAPEATTRRNTAHGLDDDGLQVLPTPPRTAKDVKVQENTTAKPSQGFTGQHGISTFFKRVDKLGFAYTTGIDNGAHFDLTCTGLDPDTDTVESAALTAAHMQKCGQLQEMFGLHHQAVALALDRAGGSLESAANLLADGTGISMPTETKVKCTPPEVATIEQSYAHAFEKGVDGENARKADVNSQDIAERLDKQALSGCGVQTSLRDLREVCGFNNDKVATTLESAIRKWSGVPDSKGTMHTKAIAMRHLKDVRAALKQAPHLALDDCRGPPGGPVTHGSFEKAFVPEYNRQLAGGSCETKAKCGTAPRAFLAQMLASTPLVNSNVNHQFERASASAQRWAVNSEVGKHKMQSILAAQVEPRSRQEDLGNGIKICKMRVLVGWEGFRQDVMNSELGLTWQATAQITGANGVYRQHRDLLEAFIEDLQGTPLGRSKGWPFKRTSGGNDKDIVFAHDVPGAVRTHVLQDDSSKNPTNY
jgi:hypothetical protein